MQTDPTGYAGGLNWYNYVGSDPINSKDPTGLSDIVVNGTRPAFGTYNGSFDGGSSVTYFIPRTVTATDMQLFQDRGLVPAKKNAAPGKKQPKKRCSAAATLGAQASNANSALEGSAAVLGLGAIAASPTGVGGGALGMGAAAAAVGAKVTSLVSIGAYGYDYIATGSRSSLLGAGAGVVSLLTSGAATRITSNVMRGGRMFGDLSAPQAARLSAAESVYGSAAGMVENLLVDTGR